MQPGDPRALNNKALSLNALNRPAEALACFDAALKAMPNHPNALINRGAALQALGRAEEAIASIDRALALDPNNASAYYYRGMGLYLLGKRNKRSRASTAPSRLAQRRDYRYSKGVALLTFGEWREAWPLFEQRWNVKRVRTGTSRDNGEPRWNGARSDGVVRVWAEQGVGDQVLFSTLVPLLLERTPRVVLECDARLVPLFRRSMPQLEAVVAIGQALPAAAQISLGSLGAALDVGIDTLARRPSPHLKADPAKRDAARAGYEKLAQGRPIVGLSWFSQNPEFGAQKSSSLDDWAPLLTRDCLFVNVQYRADAAQLAAAERKFGCTIHNDPHVDQVLDLDAFAAQIAALDHMVSVSNSGVHMAGALCAHCIVLAPPGRGLLWYWGLEGERTPWYDSVRVVRRAAEKRGARASSARRRCCRERRPGAGLQGDVAPRVRGSAGVVRPSARR